jgi:hypothetical protein
LPHGENCRRFGSYLAVNGIAPDCTLRISTKSKRVIFMAFILLNLARIREVGRA